MMDECPRCGCRDLAVTTNVAGVSEEVLCGNLECGWAGIVIVATGDLVIGSRPTADEPRGHIELTGEVKGYDLDDLRTHE